jgi:hypothetical protein
MKTMENKNIEILAEHYQKTFEVTYESWKQRSKLYLLLLGLVSVAVLLTYQAPQANPLLVDWLANALNITDTNRVAEIRNGFPFALLNSALGIAIFYTMLNLYQHSRIIRQNDVYLHGLERELRNKLDLGADSIFFTRESSYNTGERFKDAILIAWTYVISLGLLLFAFIGGRIAEDLQLKNLALIFIDSILSTMILVYFFLYARGAVFPEKRKQRKNKNS